MPVAHFINWMKESFHPIGFWDINCGPIFNSKVEKLKLLEHA